MPDTAKIFTTGGSQAIRLPRKYRLDANQEILIWREGQRIVLEPKCKQWSSTFLELAGSSPDFPTPEDAPDVEPGPELD